MLELPNAVRRWQHGTSPPLSPNRIPLQRLWRVVENSKRVQREWWGRLSVWHGQGSERDSIHLLSLLSCRCSSTIVGQWESPSSTKYRTPLSFKHGIVNTPNFVDGGEYSTKGVQFNGYPTSSYHPTISYINHLIKKKDDIASSTMLRYPFENFISKHR